MKKIPLLLSALVLIAISCDKERMALGKAASINITDARYIFKTAPSTKSLSAEEEGYWKMTAKGAVEALNFQDSDGNPLEISIKDIWEIGKSYLGVEINLGHKYLIDKRTGKLYDFPENADVSDYSLIGRLGFYDHTTIARESNGKLYLKGDYWHTDNNPNVGYYVEVDVKNQTSTRCTPDGLTAEEIVVSKDGLIAFLGDGWYVMTPDKALKKYDDNHYFFVDKENTLYMIKQYDPDSDGEDMKQDIYRIYLRGSEIAEEFVCEIRYPFELGRWSVIFPINKANGNTMIFDREGYAEFDGKGITYFGIESGLIGRELFEYDGGGYGLMHQYRYEFPEDNVFVSTSIEHNAVTLIHLDLRTHKWEKKTLTLFSDSEYSLVGNNGPSVYQQHIFYSCIRHSDSHIVSFMMDYEGNRTEVSDNSSSFSVSNFLMIN